SNRSPRNRYFEKPKALASTSGAPPVDGLELLGRHLASVDGIGKALERRVEDDHAGLGSGRSVAGPPQLGVEGGGEQGEGAGRKGRHGSDLRHQVGCGQRPEGSSEETCTEGRPRCRPVRRSSDGSCATGSRPESPCKFPDETCGSCIAFAMAAS